MRQIARSLILVDANYDCVTILILFRVRVQYNSPSMDSIDLASAEESTVRLFQIPSGNGEPIRFSINKYTLPCFKLVVD